MGKTILFIALIFLYLPVCAQVANLPGEKIGTQTWSSFNLNVDHYRNGDPIPQVQDSAAWSKLTTGAWCYSINISYGKLYNWYAVNDPRGLAPAGWRVPTETDWNKLAVSLDKLADTSMQGTGRQSSIIGSRMKLKGCFGTNGGIWDCPNIDALNNCGFGAVPTGYRSSFGAFDGLGKFTSWWSATAVPGQNNAPSSNAYYRTISKDNGEFWKTNIYKGCAYPVRVVR